jgi:hypothetical protein
MTDHTPALQTTLPAALNDNYEVMLAVPARDRAGQYPTWTVLVTNGREWLVQSAYCIEPDDRREPGWQTYDTDTFPDGGRAIDRFWRRAKAAAWRP